MIGRLQAMPLLTGTHTEERSSSICFGYNFCKEMHAGPRPQSMSIFLAASSKHLENMDLIYELMHMNTKALAFAQPAIPHTG